MRRRVFLVDNVRYFLRNHLIFCVLVHVCLHAHTHTYKYILPQTFFWVHRLTFYPTSIGCWRTKGSGLQNQGVPYPYDYPLCHTRWNCQTCYLRLHSVNVLFHCYLSFALKRMVFKRASVTQTSTILPIIKRHHQHASMVFALLF